MAFFFSYMTLAVSNNISVHLTLNQVTGRLASKKLTNIILLFQSVPWATLSAMEWCSATATFHSLMNGV